MTREELKRLIDALPDDALDNVGAVVGLIVAGGALDECIALGESVLKEASGALMQFTGDKQGSSLQRVNSDNADYSRTNRRSGRRECSYEEAIQQHVQGLDYRYRDEGIETQLDRIGETVGFMLEYGLIRENAYDEIDEMVGFLKQINDACNVTSEFTRFDGAVVDGMYAAIQAEIIDILDDYPVIKPHVMHMMTLEFEERSRRLSGC